MPPRPEARGARTYGPAIRGPWTVKKDLAPSISCPDTPRICTTIATAVADLHHNRDGSRAAAGETIATAVADLHHNRDGSRAVKSTGTTLEHQLTV